MENPRGLLRNFIGPPRETVFLCAFGSRYQKATHLWGSYSGDLRRPCTHEDHVGVTNADRMSEGQRTGYQYAPTRDAATRAKLPYGLGEELCKRMEAA